MNRAITGSGGDAARIGRHINARNATYVRHGE